MPEPPFENKFFKELFFNRQGLFEQLTVRVGLVRKGLGSGTGTYFEIQDRAMRLDTPPQTCAETLISAVAT